MDMVLPIFPTPSLSGKDAKAFIERINDKSKRPIPERADPFKVAENIRRIRDAEKQPVARDQ